MQRLVYLCTGASRIARVIGVNQLNASKEFCANGNTLSQSNQLLFKRCLASKNQDSQNSEHVDVHANLYKASTVKQGTHVPDDLKGGQPTDTINAGAQGLKKGGKVWSAQDPNSVHVAPLGGKASAQSVPKETQSGGQSHQTTVYTTQGELNFADPFKTHTLEATPAQLAEAAAASAFETFAPDAPVQPTGATEAVFAPKISSAKVYSATSSPTAHFDSAVPSASQPSPVKYEVSLKGKVFGGQDTSADSKKHPKQNPFDLKDEGKPKAAH